MAVDFKLVFVLAVLAELSQGARSFGSYGISDASLALARFRRSAFHQDDLLHSRVKRELNKIRGANGPYGYHPTYIADEDDEEGEGEEPARPEGIRKPSPKAPTSMTARRPGRGGGGGEPNEGGEPRQKGKKKKHCRCRHSSSEESEEDRGGNRGGSRRSEESEPDSYDRRRRRRRRKKKKEGEEETSEKRGPKTTPSGAGAPSGKVFKPSSENGMSVTGFHEIFIGDESDEEDGGGGVGGGPVPPQGGRGTIPSRSEGYGRGFGRRTAFSEDDDDGK